jgi:DNA-binding NarL/FixJ family response regulator
MTSFLGSVTEPSRNLAPRLTPRECDLIAEILAGRANKAIAERLGIKEQTVRNQLTALFRKLHVSSRLELATKLRKANRNEGPV